MFEDLQPYLTDMKGNENILLTHFINKTIMNEPVKKVLELGVYQLQGQQADLPGQSTKIFFMIHKYYPFEKMISVDLDDCRQTIERCKAFCWNRSLPVPPHEFIQCSSFDFKPQEKFDVILLDTSHDDDYPMRQGHDESQGGAGATYRELVYYAPFVTDHGSIFVHDTKEFYVPKQYGFNVSGAVEKCIDDYPEWEYIEHESNKHGFGELRRKYDGYPD